MRAEQWIGLNQRAKSLVYLPEILLYREIGRREFPDGRVEEYDHPVMGSPTTISQYTTCVGAFDGNHPMYEYHLPSGEIWYEAIQLEPWSSGPMTFLALRRRSDDSWIKESLWTVEDVEQVETGLVDEEMVAVEEEVR